MPVRRSARPPDRTGPTTDSTALHHHRRAGRDDDHDNRITDDLSTALAARAGIDPLGVVALSADVEASYLMEVGKLLLEPGSSEQDDWKALDA